MCRVIVLLIHFQFLLLDETHRTFFMETGKQMITGLMVKANKVTHTAHLHPMNFFLHKKPLFLWTHLHSCNYFFFLNLRVPKRSWRATRTCCFTLRERKRGPSPRWSWKAEGWVILSCLTCVYSFVSTVCVCVYWFIHWDRDTLTWTWDTRWITRIKL